MATTTAAHFKPTTDGFGHLTLRPQAGIRVLPVNLLIALAFMGASILAMTGLVMLDNAVFAHHHAQTTYYGGVPLDYD